MKARLTLLTLAVFLGAELLAAQGIGRFFTWMIRRGSETAANPLTASRLPSADTTLPNSVWAAAGVEGGIPARATQCGSTIAAYSGTAATINTAIGNCTEGQHVKLGAGTFTLSTKIDFTGDDNVTLRGSGPDDTFLIFTNSSSCLGQDSVICVPGSDLSYYGPGPPTHTATWSAGYTIGTTEITLSSVTGLAVGMDLFLDQTHDTVAASDNGNYFVCANTTMPDGSNDCTDETGTINGRDGRGTREAHRVMDIDGTTVTIEPGVMIPYVVSGESPGAWWGNEGSYIEGVGIEDLSIDTTDADSIIGAVVFMFARNSWIARTRIIYAPSPRSAVYMYQCIHCTVESNYIYGSVDDAGSSQNYGVDDFGGTQNLVQNNIAKHRTSPFVRNGTVGSVYAYNYAIDDHWDPCCFPHPFLQAALYHHELGSAMNLDEGNIVPSIKGDIIHGTSLLWTVFRNYAIGWEPNKTQETNPFLLYAYNRYWNAIGNVFGRTGYHSAYATGSDTSIYGIGLGGNFVDADPVTGTTLMRWCNWDTVTSTADTTNGDQTGTRCVSSEVPDGIAVGANPVPTGTYTNLPDSFYLGAKPPFFAGDDAWPGIGPDVSGGDVSSVGGHVHSNPAKLCYESLVEDTSYPDDDNNTKPDHFTGCPYLNGL